MAIVYPITDIIDDLDGIGWSTDFNLLYRQEQSRHASGRTRVKDFGTPIWQATYSTKNLSPNELDKWKAKLNSLENGLKTFVAYPRSRCWPIRHPNGNIIVDDDDWVLESGFWDDDGIWITALPWNSDIMESGLLNSKGMDNKTITLKEVPNLELSIGDYLSINDKLYQVMEDSLAGTDGITSSFEIRPHLSLSINVNDTVLFYRPYCLMTLIPNSISSSSGLNGRGSISFQAIESRG